MTSQSTDAVQKSPQKETVGHALPPRSGCSTGALRRELSQYANCSAEAISNGSQAMIKFFIDDAKHDIAKLAEALEELIFEADGVVVDYESTPGQLQGAVDTARASLCAAKG